MKPLWLPPDAGIKGMNHHAHLFYVLGMFCLHACLCNICLVPSKVRRALEPLVLELQVVSHHFSAGN